MDSTPLHIALRDRTTGRTIADLSEVALSATIETNIHGDHTATVEARMDPMRAAALLESAQGARYVVAAPGEAIWSGRVEEPGIREDANGARFTATAYGDQVSLDDTPYTALWSDDSLDGWEPTPGPARLGNRRLLLEKKAGLFIGPKAGQTYPQYQHGEWVYRLPPGHQGGLGAVQFDYTRNANADWAINVWAFTEDFSGATLLLYIPGVSGPSSGVAQTVPITVPWAWVSLGLVYAGGAYTHAAPDGDWGVNFLSVRVIGTTATPVTADTIVAHILSTARAEGAPLSASTARILNPGYDRRSAVYLDASRRQILDELAALGDTQSPTRRWEWWITAQGVLCFGPAEPRARYLASISSWEASRALEDVYSQIYAVYEDSAGRRAVTSTLARATAQGAIRRRALNTRARTLNEAEQQRNTAFADSADPLPRITLEPATLRSLAGAAVPLWRLRGGDTITVPDLAPPLGRRWDKLRTFRVVQTKYDLVRDALSVTLESPQPALDWLLARREQGV